MKYAICNEIFQSWNDLDRTLSYVGALGYDGLEIAPFTLAESVHEIDAATRRSAAARARAEGIEIVGLHWLLVGPKDLHLNHPEKSIRTRTAEYLKDLARLCRDLGGGLMVFGSPKQRTIGPGADAVQATDFAVATFEEVLPVCEDLDVTICMEPLGPDETDFCCTAREAVGLIERIGHPHFRLLLDTKAMKTEVDGRAATIRRCGQYLSHYHANDENLRGPGTGAVDFVPIFEALKDLRYEGFVSVEVFDFREGPEVIASDSLAYMKKCTNSG